MGGYVLTRSPVSITVLDVVEAVDGPGLRGLAGAPDAWPPEAR
ncbi:hypothetical protein [Streptomyces sp. NBC_00842]